MFNREPSRTRPFAGTSDPDSPIDDRAPPPVPAAGSVLLLSRPLNTHKGPVTRIAVGEVAYKDYVEIGPVDQVSVTEIDPMTKVPARLEHNTNRKAMSAWMVRLTGLDMIVLGELTLKDGLALETMVRAKVMAVAEGN